jgi:predicted esterase YcpF (UPF0227 family)
MHDEAARLIRRQLEELVDADAALAGTSLGGYWAARFGREFSMPAVLINPTIHPYRSLQRYVGHKLLNFVTRDRNILRREVPASYGDIERGGHFLILLDKGDEVLNYREAEQWFADGDENSVPDATPESPPPPAFVAARPTGPEAAPAGTHGCQIFTFEGGSHRFDHMDESLPYIRKFLEGSR